MIALKIFEVGILSSPSQLKCLQEIFKTDPYSNNEPSSQNIAKLWRTYSNSNHYGKYDDAIFKSIIVLSLLSKNIGNIHFNASLFPYRNIQHDCAFYSKERGPILLSINLNIEETYHLEAMKASILKQAYPRSKSFLITMDEREAGVVNKKIKTGLVLGLDDVIVANHSSFDDLINELQNYTLFEPEPIDFLKSTRFISK